MGEIADSILNGDFDEVTGEYIGNGGGFPRTLQKSKDQAEDEAWRKVIGFLRNSGVKQTQHIQIMEDYGINMNRKRKMKRACVEAYQYFDRFKDFVESWVRND